MNTFQLLRIAVIALLINGATRIFAAEYFVEMGGNDGSPGSRMQPFRSIQKAAGIMLPGDVCTVSRGLYRESIRPAVSGKPDRPIRFQSAPGESVTIAGVDEGVRWQPYTQGIYRVSATNVIQVLVDDVLVAPALDISAPVPALNLRATYGFDPSNHVLYIRLPHNDAPEGHHIEVQTRSWGLDCRKLAHIELVGINLKACGINMAGARYCRVDDAHIWWGGSIIMGGRENEVINSSVIGSDGCGIELMPDGVNNRLINNLVRGRDLPFVRSVGILVQGTAPVLRNLTVMNFTGGALLCSNVYNARIENNDFHRCGRGQTNSSLVQLTGDGKGTVLAYNWLHDNLALEGDGVLFSGPVENYLFRQTVIWGQPGVAIRLAGKVRYNYLLNNTCAMNGGNIDGSTGGEMDFSETRIMNNIMPGASWMKLGGPPSEVLWKNNYTGPLPGFVDETNRNFELTADSPCIDAGQEEPEFTDEYTGKLPDMGAYEQGKPFPRPGCKVNESANKVVVPLVKVVIESETAGAEVRYTLDGRVPDQGSPRYVGAIPVVYGARIRAKAFRPGMEESLPVTVQVNCVE